MTSPMLLILDTELHIVGRLSNDGNGTPFYNDTFTRAIAEQDSPQEISGVDDTKAFYNTDSSINTKTWSHTLDQIYVPSGYQDSNYIKQGNSIAYQDPDNYRWYVMKLNTVTDSHDSSGRGLKIATGTNIAANDLSKKIPLAASFKQSNSKPILEHLLANTGWTLSDSSEVFNSTFDVEFDGIETAQSKLQSICTIYGFEIDAYVLFSENTGQISEKVIEIKKKFGDDEGKVVFYGHNMMNVTREVIDTNLFTKLYIKDVDGGDSVKSANNGRNYIVDDKANQLYNSPLYNSAQTYLEGVIQAQKIESPEGLLDWGREQLKIFNHPRVNYTVTVSPDFKADIGDTVKVIDYDMEPELTVISRVIQKITSFSDESKCQVVLGEFATVKVITPSYIKDIEDKMDSRIKKLMEDLKNGKRQAVVQLITPTGKTWSQSDKSKKIISRVFVDGENITSYFSPAAFQWTKTDLKNGGHDFKWEEEHNNDGYEVNLAQGDKGNFICTIEGDFLKEESELSVKNDSQIIFNLNNSSFKDFWGDSINKKIDHMWFDEKNNQIIFSCAFDYGTPGQNGRSTAKDAKFHRFDINGNYIDSMIIQGGYSYNFGARLIGETPEIWLTSTDTYGNAYCLSKFNWQPNTIINRDKGLNTITELPSLNGSYDRKIAVDFNSGWATSISNKGFIEILKVDDLNKGLWLPIYSFRIQNFDIKTVISCDINFPYMFVTTQDSGNNFLYGINVVTESQVFNVLNTSEKFGDWKSSSFTPNALNIKKINEKMYIYQGFVIKDDKNTNCNVLFKNTILPRYDGNDRG